MNTNSELNIMVADSDTHIIGITEYWANKDITDDELGLEGYVMFRKDVMGRRGGADCKEYMWCKLVTGYKRLQWE